MGFALPAPCTPRHTLAHSSPLPACPSPHPTFQAGHGSLQPNQRGGYNVKLVPLDCDTAGFICDAELNRVLVNPLPPVSGEGARFCPFLRCEMPS